MRIASYLLLAKVGLKTMSAQYSSRLDLPRRSGPVGAASPPDPFSLSWYHLFLRPQIVQSLEAVHDLIAVSLCVGLFCVMAFRLNAIFASLFSTPRFHEITADILFILILVELFAC